MATAQSDLTTTTSVRLALHEQGRVPVPVTGKVPTALGKDWDAKARAADAEQVRDWATKHAQAQGTGVLNASQPFLDADITDKALAATCHALCRDHLTDGRLLTRFGKAPKFAIPIRWADSLPPPGTADVVTATRPDPKNPNRREVLAHIELRAGGGQTVVHGPHPEGGDYRWQSGPKKNGGQWTEGPSLWEVEREALPSLDYTKLGLLVGDLMQAFRGHYAGQDGVTVENRSSGLRPARVSSAAKHETIDDPVIRAFNARYSLLEVLSDRGYHHDPRGATDRMLFPGSATGLAGVLLYPDGTCWSCHTADPLADGRIHDSFDVVRLLDFEGDPVAARAWAETEVGGDAIAAEQTRMLAARLAEARTEFTTVVDDSQPPPLALVRASELRSRVKPPEFVLEDLIAEGELNYLGGNSNTGKSALMLAWGCSAACQVPQWGGKTLKPQVVVYLAQEGRSSLPARLQVWSQVSGQDVFAAPFWSNDNWCNLGNTDATKRLAKDIRAALEDAPPTGPFLSKDGRTRLTVVVDTQAASVPGMQEKEANETAPFLARLRLCLIDALADIALVTVVIVHHSPKADPWDLRGSSAQRAGVDNVIMIGRDPSQPGYVKIVLNKAREASTSGVLWARPRGVVLQDEHGQDMRNELGNTASVVVLEHVPDLAADQASRGNYQLVDLLTKVDQFREVRSPGEALGVRALRGLLPGRAMVVESLRDAAIKQGLLEDVGTEYRRDYRLTEAGKEFLSSNGVFSTIVERDDETPF